MTRSCPQCGEIHPVLVEHRPLKRDRESLAAYRIMSRALRVKRNELFHGLMEATTVAVLYGDAKQKPVGLLK